jgi:hypothetical protein
VHNIKIDIREIGLDGMNRIDEAQDRAQWRALYENDNELSDSIKCWETLE